MLSRDTRRRDFSSHGCAAEMVKAGDVVVGDRGTFAGYFAPCLITRLAMRPH
jgi:hypothetical protein